jgi:integrative and conjugative element protein (TIGR02256 family)
MGFFVENFGQSIEGISLTIDKAKEFIDAVNLNPFAQLIEVRKNSKEDEIIIIDLNIEKPQICKNDIRDIEQVAVLFHSENNLMPEIFALREDFPSVPHLNLKEFDHPKCLCLYEEPYEELKLRWSSFSFLERIREWLCLTAKGKLHATDQVLEPLLFFTNSYIVLPNNLFEDGKSELLVAQEIHSKDCLTLIAQKPEKIQNFNSSEGYLTTCFLGNPQTHGIISRVPKNFKDLYELFDKCEIDLKTQLRNRLRKWKEENKASLFESRLIIVLYIPMRRDPESKIESFEERAFVTKIPAKEIGIKLGLWAIINDSIGLNIVVDENKSGEEIEIGMLNPVKEITPKLSMLLNNVPESFEEIKIFCVGLGTLGSQIYDILIRQGIGKWVLLDSDIILPHNLARHISSKKDLGFHKSNILTEYGNNLYGDINISQALITNILRSTDKEQEVLKAKINESELIFDFSASIPVARKLSNDFLSTGRRVSAFFTPNGLDSVLISEDSNRMSKLDMLEMQYYRGILNDKELYNHLTKPSGKFRIGYSCRDITTILPYDLTVQHAGVISAEIKNIISTSNAGISIWRLQDGGIKKYSIPISKETRIMYDEWTLVFDEYFVNKIYAMRATKLPNETGGALIGSYDKERKIIYVVDSINSPTDSVEWPTVYIRGIKGMKEKIEHIEKVTDQMLTYIGEWHSHPKGCPPFPSGDDIKAFLWLTEVLNESGLLSLMLIAGDTFKFYLGKMINEYGI